MQSHHCDWIIPQAQSPLSSQLSAVVTLSARRLFGNSKSTHGCQCLHVIFLTIYGNMELAFFSSNKNQTKLNFSDFNQIGITSVGYEFTESRRISSRHVCVINECTHLVLGKDPAYSPVEGYACRKFWGYTPEEQAARSKKTITEKLSTSIKGVSWQRPWLIAHHIMANYRRSRAALVLIIR